MAATASTLYPHVHQFLVQAGLTKTAEKFVKEAKFTPGDERAERDLLEIYNLYLVNEPKKATKRKHVETETKVATEEAATEPKKKDKKKSKSEAPAPIPTPEPVVVEEPVEKKKKSKKNKDEPVAVTAAVSEPETESVLPKKSNKSVAEITTKSDSSSETSEASTPVANGNGKKKSSKKATPAPFQRIDPGEKLDILPDHEFDATAIGCGTTWGQRANEKLSVTRGKGFRHEKTKAKRGTYRGGELETGVRSIKFD